MPRQPTAGGATVKHGHPPVTSTTPTLIRAGAAIVCVLPLSTTVILITALKALE